MDDVQNVLHNLAGLHMHTCMVPDLHQQTQLQLTTMLLDREAGRTQVMLKHDEV